MQKLSCALISPRNETVNVSLFSLYCFACHIFSTPQASCKLPPLSSRVLLLHHLASRCNVFLWLLDCLLYIMYTSWRSGERALFSSLRLYNNPLLIRKSQSLPSLFELPQTDNTLEYIACLFPTPAPPRSNLRGDVHCEPLGSDSFLCRMVSGLDDTSSLCFAKYMLTGSHPV